MNNFGALRLFAALLVLLGHSYVIAGEQAPRWFGMEVHNLALHVFFAISGYLIAGSWLADPAWSRFVARRALRIMPALATVVLVCVLLIGPAFTALPLRAYATDPETWTYLWNIALAPYFALPGVFQDGRPFTAVNGALWSLPVEVAMYALTPLLALRWTLARRVLLPLLVLAALAAAFTFAVLRPGQIGPVLYWTSIPFALRFAGDFALAAAIRLWRLEAGLNLQAALALLALLALLPDGSPRGGLLLLVLPYAVLSFALARPALLGGVGRRTDLSYGVYLWAGPVQQMVVSVLGPQPGVGRLLLGSLLGCCIMAWLSWHLVERPALAWKPARRATPRTEMVAESAGVP